MFPEAAEAPCSEPGSAGPSLPGTDTISSGCVQKPTVTPSKGENPTRFLNPAYFKNPARFLNPAHFPLQHQKQTGWWPPWPPVLMTCRPSAAAQKSLGPKGARAGCDMWDDHNLPALWRHEKARNRFPWAPHYPRAQHGTTWMLNYLLTQHWERFGASG